MRNPEDWEDPGYRYIWSEKAVRFLQRLGVENWHAVIAEVDEDYQRERGRGTVRAPERLARRMVRNAGLSALRASSIQSRGRQRPIIRERMERQDPETGKTYSPLDRQVRFQASGAEEALDELRSRLRREDEQGDHRAQLEHVRRRLGERMLGR